MAIGAQVRVGDEYHVSCQVTGITEKMEITWLGSHDKDDVEENFTAPTQTSILKVS